MIRCSKCSIDKPESDYATYFHSTQNKMRRRKICRFCFNEQKRQYNQSIRNKKIIQPVEDMTPIQPIIDHSTNPDYKACKECNEYKPIDSFHYFNKEKGLTFNTCKDCEKENDRIYNEQLKEQNGGSKMVGAKPNTYFDEYQKKNTFEVMTLLGYLYNEEYGIWTKLGVKTIEDGKPYFHFLKYYKKGNKGGMITQTERDKILEYREKGFSFKRISIITKISPNSIYKIIKEHEDKDQTH
jgi:hypothetical protein